MSLHWLNDVESYWSDVSAIFSVGCGPCTRPQIYLLSINDHTEGCVHDVSVGIQTHSKSEEQRAVIVVSIKEIAVVMARVT